MTYRHTVQTEKCKGCGFCIVFCPKKVLEISDQVSAEGYFPAYQARPENCIHCAICCTMCPDIAINIEETR